MAAYKQYKRQRAFDGELNKNSNRTAPKNLYHLTDNCQMRIPSDGNP